jgi:hypothetical protein
VPSEFVLVCMGASILWSRLFYGNNSVAKLPGQILIRLRDVGIRSGLYGFLLAFTAHQTGQAHAEFTLELFLKQNSPLQICFITSCATVA